MSMKYGFILRISCYQMFSVHAQIIIMHITVGSQSVLFKYSDNSWIAVSRQKYTELRELVTQITAL